MCIVYRQLLAMLRVLQAHERAYKRIRAHLIGSGRRHVLKNTAGGVGVKKHRDSDAGLLIQRCLLGCCCCCGVRCTPCDNTFSMSRVLVTAVDRNEC